jgi:GNAT superfamily N-acetyltransferase
MQIRELTDDQDRREAVPILCQIWGDADPDDVLEWTGDDDYHLFGVIVDSEVVGVAGVLVRDILHHARHAWLYDLVVDEAHRGDGHGTKLLEFVETWATEQECEFVALASPLAKEGVHQYYENQNYKKRGYVIEKSL